MKKILIFFALALFLSYSISSAQTKDVIVDQQLDDNSSTDEKVGLWNTALTRFDDYSVPQTFPWTIGTTKTLRGFQGIEEGEKYKHWINNTSVENNVVNHKTFTIYSYTDNLTSKFDYTHTGITIQTDLEETGVNSGVVEFRDPWFIDYQDGQYANQLSYRGMGKVGILQNNFG